ncbi:hypothetical protein ACIQMJ_40195 [Actinosynnema sp. NPDC091369]
MPAALAGARFRGRRGVAGVEKPRFGFPGAVPVAGRDVGFGGRVRRSFGGGRARDIESDQRRGRLVDPSVGGMPLGEWVPVWADAHDVSATTWAKYDSYLRKHVLPRFGDVPLGSSPGSR